MVDKVGGGRNVRISREWVVRALVELRVPPPQEAEGELGTCLCPPNSFFSFNADIAQLVAWEK